MQSMFFPESELTIPNESVRFYSQLAYKHLQEHNITIAVEYAGEDETGQSIFGICMRSDDGEEEWYDPSDVKQAMAGWINKKEAHHILKTKVVPNLGYVIYQRDLQLFHQNMIHE